MPSSDADAVARLDIEYQAAVERNDAATMDRILLDGFVLVTGSGKTFTKDDLLEEARSGKIVYDRQDAAERTVRCWGDTAVVTALLSAKGTEAGIPFAYRVWFTDTYVRTPSGWRYAHGQSGARLPGPP
ncbi:MAG: nuclear transport factor 2 family protein [Thermoplasmata archaeon]|nr:nuclear transport factor 2 family protein [Thermoplasmata archaeon]